MVELAQMDQTLADAYGPYASYSTGADPALVDTYGDGPAQEVDRLLDGYARPTSRVLDLGCGAGFTLCRLAPRVAEIWGFDLDERLLAAARLRAAQHNLPNTHFVLGNVSQPADTARLPEAAFDLVYSRRGPNVNGVIGKLAPGAIVVQEVFQDCLGLLELFGRKSPLAQVGHNPRWLIEQYAALDLFPVSVKEYYFDSFFRDSDHLAAYLAQQTTLYSWPMPPMPYQPERDRPALELYARYHATPRGIRIVNTRSVYVFRRAPVLYAPVDPHIRPAP